MGGRRQAGTDPHTDRQVGFDRRDAGTGDLAQGPWQVRAVGPGHQQHDVDVYVA